MFRALGALLVLLSCRPGPSGDLGQPEAQTSASVRPPQASEPRTPRVDEKSGKRNASGPNKVSDRETNESNDAARLVAVAERITAVIVVDADRKLLGELPPTVLVGLRHSLATGPTDDLTLATPPWEVALEIAVDGHSGFVAIPVGFDRVRLSPTHPYDATIADDEGRIDPRVREVVVGEAVHEAIGTLAGPPSAKEFQPRPRKAAKSLDAWYEQHRARRPDGK